MRPARDLLTTTSRGRSLWRIHVDPATIADANDAPQINEGDLLIHHQPDRRRASLLKVVQVNEDGTILTIRGCSREIR